MQYSHFGQNLIAKKPLTFPLMPNNGRGRSRKKKHRLETKFWKNFVHRQERRYARKCLYKLEEPGPIRPLGVSVHYI